MLIQSRKHQQSGFTLMELLIVIGVASLFVVGVVMYFLKASSAQKANAEMQNVITITTGLKNLYATNPSYTSLGTDGNKVVIDSHIAPSSMVVGTALRNSWGGAVTIGSAAVYGGTDNAFSITYDAVPSAECVSLVTGTANNYLKVEVGGTAMVDKEGGTANVDPGKTAAACNSAPQQTVIWVSN